jgi:alpha-1,3/alpha-1,6-mannosyltransferase
MLQVGMLDVRVHGDWLPTSILGKFAVFCAWLRMFYCTLILLMFERSANVFFIDQVSIPVPFLKWFGPKKARVVFYCHFPDKLLSRPGNVLKSFYRLPFDYCEEVTTLAAHCVLVNSKFTLNTVRRTWPSVSALSRAHQPRVLYPGIHIAKYQAFLKESFDPDLIPDDDALPTALKAQLAERTPVVLSLNRYEEKKRLNLWMDAARAAQTTVPSAVFIHAGGYDPLNGENKTVFEGMEQRKPKNAFLLKSISEDLKMWLLCRCLFLIYTPPNEHFGIVPLEAMACGRAVIALNSGGPTETIHHMQSGILCEEESDIASFAEALLKDWSDQQQEVSKDPRSRRLSRVSMMGQTASKNVLRFSQAEFARALEDILYECVFANGVQPRSDRESRHS